MTISAKARRAALLSCCILFDGSIAAAQTSTPPVGAAEGDMIVVTGSRIRRDPLDQDKPVATVDAEASIAQAPA
jgi:iron complex outermembrane receptor protein